MKLRYFFLFHILLIILVLSVIANAAHHEDETGVAIFFDALDEDRGIDFSLLFNEAGIETEKEKFDIARFYRQILKVRADPDTIEDCAQRSTEESFQNCLEEHYQNDPLLQKKFEDDIAAINYAADVAETRGMYYRDVPFIRDFLA